MIPPKVWPPEKPDERHYAYDPAENILWADWDDEDGHQHEPARHYAEEERNPSEEEIERDVRLLKQMDRVGF